MKKKKKKKASNAVRTQEKPISARLTMDANKFAKLAYQSIHGTCEVVR